MSSQKCPNATAVTVKEESIEGGDIGSVYVVEGPETDVKIEYVRDPNDVDSRAYSRVKTCSPSGILVHDRQEDGVKAPSMKLNKATVIAVKKDGTEITPVFSESKKYKYEIPIKQECDGDSRTSAVDVNITTEIRAEILFCNTQKDVPRTYKVEAKTTSMVKEENVIDNNTRHEVPIKPECDQLRKADALNVCDTATNTGISRPTFNARDVLKSFINRNQITIKPTHGETHLQISEEYQKAQNNSLPQEIFIEVDCIDASHICGECGKAFGRKSELRNHEKVHLEKIYTCRFCEKTFNRKNTLRGHERIHSGEKPFTCEECGKTFNLKGNLSKHQKIHTGDKKHRCSDCGKTFRERIYLIAHERVHTGVMPYYCQHCGKLFKERSNLSLHSRVHSGVKPFGCAVCGKAFSQRISLIYHERVHTGEKPFNCGYCGKAFRGRNNLTAHERIHNKQK